MRITLCSFTVLFLIFSACNTMEPDFSGSNLQSHASFNKIINSSDADFIINSTSDAQDVQWNGNGYEIPGPDGLLTLREAILLSNYYPGQQKIAFNIPTTDPGYQNGVFTIKPLFGWDIIVDDGVILDGATQTEYTGDTNPSGPEIVLDGGLSDGNGVRLNSSNNQINSLVINNFLHHPGIDMSGIPGMKNNKITGCYIGTDPTGTIAQPNNWIGIHIVGPNASGMIIGGPEEWQRNIISGNYNDGIQILGATNCLIENNYIGTDVSGTQALGNERSGISMVSDDALPTSNNIVINNLVSGNGENGIIATSLCIIKRNLVGTDKYGNSGLGNAWNGVSMFNQESNPVSGVIIGGNEEDGNVICGNGASGIVSEAINSQITFNIIHDNGWIGIGLSGNSVLGNLLSRNSVYNNDQLGIDLNMDGVTLNDPGDIDTGPNRLLNFPVLDKIKLTNGRLIIQGDVDAEVRGKLTIEVYANHSADPTGYGEGEIFLGSKQTNPHGKFTLTFPPINPGMYITLLAIDENNNTSEFSFAYPVEVE